MKRKIQKKRRGYLKIAITALVLLLSITGAMAQDGSLSDIQTKFIRFRKQDLREKLYVQTNKDFYLAGETLWFGIYDIHGADNTPFDFSKVAYIELLDKDQIPILQVKVSLDSNKGGSIELPLTLRSGNYTLRAYTKWMMNFSPEGYFHKEITIVNTNKGGVFPTLDSSRQYNFQFFPEGGNLVNGLQSTIAFKLTDQYGKATGFEGWLMNEDRDTLLQFHPYKLGMGRFSFTPEKGKRYRAVIHTEDGSILKAELPVIYDTGYVMHVETRNKDRIKITVNCNILTAQKIYLLIHTRGDIKVGKILTLKGGKAVFELNRDKMGEGISQLTVFNNSGQPVCERLYFRPVKKRLTIHTTIDQAAYKKRQKVKLHLSSKGKRQKGVAATLSVSVYKIDRLQHMGVGNILNYLWLGSELKGRIENPDYYFGERDSILRAVDNLMMTQGWRRFGWQEILGQNPGELPYAPELKGLVITGVVRHSRDHTIAPATLTYLSVPGKKVNLYVSRSDDTGRVYFNLKDFYGPQQIVVRTNTRTKDSLDEITVLNSFSEKYADLPLYSFPVDTHDKELLQDHHLWMQVAQAYHDKEHRHWRMQRVDTVAFYGKPFQTYLLDNYTRYVTMEEVLKEYVSEVVVRRRKKHYHLMVTNALFDFDRSMSSTLFQDDPLVLFDGVPVFDLDKVMAFDPLKIQKIEIVAGRYFYGPLVADGIVSFTTYKGDLRDYKLNPHAIVLDYEGLQRKRIFYEPDYGTRENSSSSRIPDFRNALYWSPHLKTDERGKATCSFFTSDLPGKYIVVVNGITADGCAGSTVEAFEVK